MYAGVGDREDGLVRLNGEVVPIMFQRVMVLMVECHKMSHGRQGCQGS